jgi:hypothetical protein
MKWLAGPAEAGKGIENHIRALLLNSADGRMVARLTQSMVKVIQADITGESCAILLMQRLNC